MSMECEEVRVSLGVYVLGAIEPAERSVVDAHLSTCPACRDELAGIAGLPALLGRVSEAQIEALAEPPPELLETLLARAARDRRPSLRERWAARLRALGDGRWTPLVAAAAVMLVVGTLFGGFLGDRFGGSPSTVTRPTPSPSHSHPPGEELRAFDPHTGVSARLVVFARKSGTQAQLNLSGVPVGSQCRLEAVNRRGQRDSMGSWKVAYRNATFTGSTMFQREEVTSFQIVTDGEQTLLVIPAS